MAESQRNRGRSPPALASMNQESERSNMMDQLQVRGHHLGLRLSREREEKKRGHAGMCERDTVHCLAFKGGGAPPPPSPLPLLRLRHPRPRSEL